MKKNLLPDMQKVKMTDREGVAFAMEIGLRKTDKFIYVFLSDTHHPGASRLAQDAMYYIKKIAQRLDLDKGNAIFYRHIYQEQMGSTFGRFNVDWKNDLGPSYKFQMLTNVDDLQNVNYIIANSTPLSLEEQVSERKSA